jgi:hypothetical protein
MLTTLRDFLLIRNDGCCSVKQAVPFFLHYLRCYGLGLIPQFINDTRKDHGSVIINAAYRKGNRVCSIIVSPGVRRLQSIIIGRHFVVQFGIKPVPRDLRVLSHFSSLPWLSAELIRAAGCGNPAYLDEDDLYRCRVVYPAFAKGLQVHLKYRLGKSTGFTIQLSRMFGLQSRLRLRRKGCNIKALSELYPAKLDRRRTEAIIVEIKDRRKLQLMRLKRMETERYLELHLAGISLLCRSKKKDISAVERLLAKLERIHL